MKRIILLFLVCSILLTGCAKIGVQKVVLIETKPTAKMRILGFTTTENTGPIKFTAGIYPYVVESGPVNFNPGCLTPGEFIMSEFFKGKYDSTKVETPVKAKLKN